jgi:general secretion pathway protein M
VNAAAQAFAPLRSQAQSRWQALAPREKRLLRIAAVLIGLALLWFVALAPALKVVRTAPAQLALLDSQYQAMQRDAADAKALRDVAPVGAAQSSAALRTATEAMGAAARLSVTGDRATLTLSNAGAAQLREWLSEARATARARVVEANLTQTPGNGQLNGTVVVALPGAGP